MFENYLMDSITINNLLFIHSVFCGFENSKGELFIVLDM